MAARIATAEDLDGLVDIAESFVAETGYAIEFDRDLARNTLWSYIYDGHADRDVLVCGDPVVGGAMVVSASEFQAKPFCYVVKLFVAPVGRGQGVAKELLTSIKNWAIERGCSHIFATATAGLADREQRAFVALMRRAGYAEVGPVLCREVSDGQVLAVAAAPSSSAPSSSGA